MSNDLSKKLSLEDALQQTNSALTIADFNNVSVGDYILTKSDYDPIVQVANIEVNERNDKKFLTFVLDMITIDYDTLELTAYRKHSVCSSDFRSYYMSSSHFKSKDSLIEYIQLANKAMSNELVFEEQPEISQSTALMHASSKDTLASLQQSIESKRQHLSHIRNLVNIKLKQETNKLREIKNKLQEQMAIFNKQIQVIMKTIQSIELYLGISEDLFQIQSGEPASAETQISFRQLILFMDEEVGNTDYGGWDYSNISSFDKWLITNDNYLKLVPEEKCVVIFKPRRYDKRYSDNAFENSMRNQYNKTTYVLIRNGENLYRIYSENLSVHEKLFPKNSELQDILDKLNDDTNKSSYEKERLQKTADEHIELYSRQALLLQGLIDRSQVFYPLAKPDVNIFKLDKYGEYFNFIYDAEQTLYDGRLRFRDWQKLINSKLQCGSRIVISNAKQAEGDYGGTDRYVRYYDNKYKFPSTPSDGLYVVDKYGEFKDIWINNGNEEWLKSEIAKREESGEWYEVRTIGSSKVIKYWQPMLSIMYNDKYKSDFRAYYDDRRINRTRYKIYTHDKFILNYDQIDLADIEYYLSNRIDRPNYLNMLPVLRQLKQLRLSEIESEKLFAQLVLKETSKTEQEVFDAIDWWKFKNQWKRPIAQDDAKALRMIVKYLNKK
jgi:hypothetical protein